MPKIENIKKIDEREQSIKSDFCHFVDKCISSDPPVFRTVLLERRHLSLMFTEVYDYLLEAIESNDAKGIVREIIREEYPTYNTLSDSRSHREDLVIDMEAAGISRVEIISHRPSARTLSIMSQTRNYVFDILSRDDRSLSSIVFLRMWGEILTALEYQSLWAAGLSKVFTKTSDSVFYWYHFVHDQQRKTLFADMTGESANKIQVAPTHSDRLTACVVKALKNEVIRQRILEVDEAAVALKMDFYRQFKPE